eukprot:TRINITY_DN7745_c0_g2_i2.p1 TRINITY_DN7745_c0_g2~~TRINITY_DN7745_c0_g2_i2.p1  ORF type:complete len:416 (+),score=9.08 TRINITY_DN7745_c0_g2_i2:204-1451(+)
MYGYFCIAIVLLLPKLSKSTTTDCSCVDSTPLSGIQCYLLKLSNNCNIQWLVDGSYCEATCGRCSCQAKDKQINATNLNITSNTRLDRYNNQQNHTTIYSQIREDDFSQKQVEHTDDVTGAFDNYTIESVFQNHTNASSLFAISQTNGSDDDSTTSTNNMTFVPDKNDTRTQRQRKQTPNAIPKVLHQNLTESLSNDDNDNDNAGTVLGMVFVGIMFLGFFILGYCGLKQSLQEANNLTQSGQRVSFNTNVSQPLLARNIGVTTQRAIRPLRPRADTITNGSRNSNNNGEINSFYSLLRQRVDPTSPNLGQTTSQTRQAHEIRTQNNGNNYDCILYSLPSADMMEKNRQGICAICLEELKDVLVQSEGTAVLPCYHVFHKKCIRQWLRTKGECAKCPLCKTEIKQNNFAQTLLFP